MRDCTQRPAAASARLFAVAGAAVAIAAIVLPHPRMSAFALTREERTLARISKDGPRASWFEPAQSASSP